MGILHADKDRVRTTQAHAHRACKDVFLNKLESQNLAVADFTDNANTTGYIDIDVDLPANALVVGWKSVITEGFAGDTTAVMQVGIAGDLNKYSGITTSSCLASATVCAPALFDSAIPVAAQTVRVTVTGGADFTTIKTADNGAMIVSLYYFLAW